jgi:molybdenum cofactor cytidylyltransferase
MRFERLPLGEALGAIAGHTVGCGKNAVKKGAVFDAAALAALEKAGVSHVYAVRLEAGDVAENDAAKVLADALGGDHARVEALATGRANLRALDEGVALIDSGGVNRFNRVYEGITLATVTPFARVKAGERVATVKIVPFAVEGAAMERALRACSGARLVSVAPFRPHRVGLLLTRVRDTKPSLLKKSETALSERVAALGSQIVKVEAVDHETGAIAEGISRMGDASVSLLIVLGAAAIADRNDVVPAGLVRGGGTVTHIGMPVEPGNLLMLGWLGELPVIGAPSCARSPKENGFDWVMQRLLAGLEIGPEEIMGLGVGGLLL